MAPTTLDPRAVLGLPEDATLVDAKRAFRRLAKRTHPDAGGDGAAFAAVAGAFASLRPKLAAPRRSTPYDWSLRPAPALAPRPAARPAASRPVTSRSFAAVLAAAMAQ